MNNTDAIDKVRKLLALANSANEHEAAAAAARAAEIMERYRLDAAMVAQAEQRQVEQDEAFAMNEDLRGDRTHARMPTWYWTLAWAIADANRCMLRRVWVVRGRTAAVAFAGRPSDAQAARYMLDAIANEVDRLGSEYVARLVRGSSRAAGKSFRLGCAVTISDRLGESVAQTTSAVRAELRAAGDEQGLVRLDHAIAQRTADAKRLEDFMAANGVRYRSAGSTSVSSASAFAAGQSAGQSVNLRGGTAALGTGARALGSGR
jgi:hypothetical protein